MPDPDWWGQEILRRAGTAPLWIKCTQIERYAQQTVIQLLLTVLDTRWDRVERLYVRSAIIDDQGESMAHHLWECLLKRAPSLKQLGLYISGRENAPLSRPLLGDSAPLLKVLRINRLTFSVQAPWLSGLRSLTIGSTTPSDLLQVLEGISHLEALRVDDICDDGEADVGDKPSLPSVLRLRHLEQFDISASQLTPCSTFLKQITTSSKCSSVSLRFLIPKKDSSRNILPGLLLPFSQFLDRYLAFFPESAMSMTHTPDAFTLSSSEPNNSNSFMLTICFEGKYSFTAYLLAIILGTFTSGMPKVVSMKFGTFRTTQQVVETIISFLPRFTSLITLEADERFILRLMEEKENHTGLLLPTLRTININAFNVSFFGSFGGIDEENRSPLVDYLVLRMVRGSPIGVLDLTQCPDLDVRALVPVLENSNLAGLNVLWARYSMSGVRQRFQHMDISTIDMSEYL
ncbi:hypothetical protein JR316_0011073 [Psilocybe cubensis]|uniref:Uncharacterized protein n=1 Tax=Psilocybe cubensis TaxID=181762 RepID=A0ACB8GNA2_PSICU|nr:hypothetical protein JR316_0011073 [Psilocybe cubensis]KAH9477156.1 hypothetical protein JR316_0011073 [Psilocybe cubensis]